MQLKVGLPYGSFGRGRKSLGFSYSPEKPHPFPLSQNIEPISNLEKSINN